MVKKTFVFLALILALGFSMVGSGHVQAVSGLTFQSGVQVVNLDPNNVANITLDYYRQSDGAKEISIPDTIAKGGSKTYFPITGIPAGFNGSLVISSDVPVVSIADTNANNFAYGDASSSFSGGSTTFNLPIIMCNNGGFDTFFNIQNAGGSDANITIAYNPGSAGASGVTESATIKPGAAKTFDQSLGSTTKNCLDLKGAGTKFVGSATITSNVPVVASVMEVNTTTTYKSLLAYNGFPSGFTTVNLPLIMTNNGGFWTGINVQNLGTVATNITITYSPNTAGATNPPADTTSCVNIQPGKTCTVLQTGGIWTYKYVGSAILTNSAGQPLAGMVNQLSAGSPTTGPFGSAYDGFDANAATASVVMPLIMSNNSGFWTSFQAMNVGTGSCNVTVTYGPNTAGAFAPANEVFSLAAGASKTVLQTGTPPGNGSANNWATAGKYVGSASGVGTGAGCKLVAVVNQLRPTSTGDTLFTYGAFNN